MTWKTKVSKANVLLFQLQASVHGIKEKGSGLLPTPVVSDHLHNQSESIENWTKRSKEKKKQGINLHFALRHHVQMYPTPTTMDHIDRKGMRPSRAATNRKTGYLSEMIKMYPTPATRDYKDSTLSNSHQNRNSDSLPVKMMKEGKPGGKLNPKFVEFLMGYPMNWTKIDPTE
jgi:hypothetical protein